jgi:toxin ParE1/3/4
MARSRELLWSGHALRDLEEIRDYVSRDKPAAAKKLAKSIRQAVLRLKTHPRSGRIVPELSDHGYREVIVAPYRIVYEVHHGLVVILRVWHSRRAFLVTGEADD